MFLKIYKLVRLVLFLLLATSCIKSTETSADLSAFNKETDDLLTATGAFGGGENKFGKPVVFQNSKCSFAEPVVLVLTIEAISGEMKISPEKLALPPSWENFSELKTTIVNKNDFQISVSFGVSGRWLRSVEKATIEANEKKTLALALDELSLIASKENPFSPVFIVFEASSEKQNFDLLIESITLKKSEGFCRRPVVDKFGQRKKTNWEGKVVDELELAKALQDEKGKIYPSGPETDLYGGKINGQKFAATGFFRYEKINDKWWFITPEGNLFWSLGVTGIRPKNDRTDVTWTKGREFMFEDLPEKDGPFADAWVGDDRFSFYYLNLLRKYKNINSWRNHIFERLNIWGINTIGNWSEDSLLNISRIPFTKSFDTKVPELLVGHGLGDYFNPAWVQAVDSVLQQARQYRDNKYLLGYFADNEQGWGKGDFSEILVFLPDSAYSRQVWLNQMKAKYRTTEQVNSVNHTSFASWDEIKALKDASVFPLLKEDIIDFETAFAAQYFEVVSSTLKKYDPNHLYLGCRFTRQPKPLHIMQTAGKFCDVITVNVYTFIPEELETWHKATQKPILIGEHHVPLASERQFPPNYKCFPEKERQAYYLSYVETWAKMPFSLGCHWYQFADQHLTGRSNDGECQTVGLVDITDQPHAHMIDAVNKASGKIYDWHILSNNTHEY